MQEIEKNSCFGKYSTSSIQPQISVFTDKIIIFNKIE
jgi:hypothetical protein